MDTPDFPEKGKYRMWDKSWNPLPTFSDTPTYPGQMPIRFPLDWTPFACAIAAHSQKA